MKTDKPAGREKGNKDKQEVFSSINLGKIILQESKLDHKFIFRFKP